MARIRSERFILKMPDLFCDPSKPYYPYLDEAERRMNEDVQAGKLHYPNDVVLWQSMVKLEALRLYHAAQAPKEPETNIAERQQLLNEQQVCPALLGQNHQYAKIYYSSPETKSTPCLDWLMHEFNNLGKRDAIICGPPGAGKTYGVLAYLSRNAVIGERYDNKLTIDAMFFDYVDLYRLYKQKSTDDKEETIKKLYTKRWLVIDNLIPFGCGLTSEKFEYVFMTHLIRTRQNMMKRTIITTSASFAQMGEWLPAEIKSRFGEFSPGVIKETAQHDLRQQ